MILGLLGCAVHLRYEPVAFEVPPLQFDHATLARAVTLQLERGHLGPVERRMSTGTVPIGPAEVGLLQDTELYALIATAGRWSHGAEIDLLVPTERGDEPVTLWVDRDGSLLVAAGERPVSEPLPPSHVDERRLEQELKRR